MNFEEHQFYHLYNRTNNSEIAFKEQRNYIYFLQKYRKLVAPFVETHAYCLMPTHFHFLIRIREFEEYEKDGPHLKGGAHQPVRLDTLRRNIGIWQSSFTKAINKAYNRHGSLFQRHTKALLVDEDSYLISLINYIHQNPIRAGLVDRLEQWPFSSYLDLAGLRQGTLVARKFVSTYFTSSEDFIAFSHEAMVEVKEKYWVGKSQTDGPHL